MTFYSRKIFESGNSGLKKPELDNKPVCLPCLRNPTKHGIPTALVFSLGIAGATFLIISYFALRRFASQRRSSLPPPTYSNREEFADGLQWPDIDHPVWHIRTNGLPQSVIESIQQFSYKKGDGFIGTSDCSVCLSEFEDGESLRLLPKCSHAFHGACIDTWLGSHTNCPLCRAPILGGGGGQLGTVESRSILASSRREGNGGIESREEGSGEIGNGGGNSNRAMIGEEMEGVRRSVSLDFSSAVDVNVEAKKAFWTKRSISISGPSILV